MLQRCIKIVIASIFQIIRMFFGVCEETAGEILYAEVALGHILKPGP